MNCGPIGIGLPKWQMALLLSAPLAIGIGYLYMRKAPAAGNQGDNDRDQRRSLANAAPSLSLDSNDETLASSETTASTAVSKAGSKASTRSASSASTKSVLDQAIVWKNEGNRSFRSGKFNDAIRSYGDAIAHCTLDHPTELATFYQNRAAAYEQLKNWAMVEADCTEALKHNPNYAKALSRRAKAYEARDELQKSLEDITGACIVEGFRNDVSLTYADQVLKRLGKFARCRRTKCQIRSKHASCHKHLWLNSHMNQIKCQSITDGHFRQSGERNAKKAMVDRDVVYPSDSLVKAYFASFSNDPLKWTKSDDNADPLFGLPRAQYQLDRHEYADCVDACTQELEMTVPHKPLPESALDAYLLRGSLRFLSGQLDAAQEDFTTVLASAEADQKRKSNAFVRRALIYVHKKQWLKAIDDFADAQKVDENNSDVYQQRAVVYVQMDRIDDALVEMDRVLKINPGLSSAQCQRAYFVYRQSVGADDAVKTYSAVQQLHRLNVQDPSDVECCNLLAQVLTEQQQYDKALPILQHIIELDKRNASAHVHMGLLHLQWNGDIDKAIASIERAIEIDQKCELAYETYGTIEVQRGRLQHAIDLFEKALKLCRTELELVHVYSLRDAALAQLVVAQRMELNLERLAEMTFATA